MVKWANNLGLHGIDSSKYVDDKAAIGTLAHMMVTDYLQKKSTDTSDYSQKQIDQAENSLLSFFEWEKVHTIEPILIEKPLVSEKYQYGGTIDCLAVLDGNKTLIDFKTGKSIWPEMFYQLAAYDWLLQEHHHNVYNSHIIRIGRDESEGFEDRFLPSLKPHWSLFLHCLAIYNIQKEINKSGH